MDLATFNNIINDISSEDNQKRAEAEKKYEELACDAKAHFLFQLYQQTEASIEVRSTCLVLLRRLLSNNFTEITEAVGRDKLSEFSNEVLNASMKETVVSLRKKLSDVIAELAREMIDEESGAQKWPAVITYIDHCSKSEDVELKLSAMLLIDAVPNVFGNEQERYLQEIKQMIRACLVHPSAPVRSAATKAFVSFLTFNEDDDKLVKGFSSDVPAILEVCSHVVSTEEDDDGPLQALADLVSTTPKVVIPHIDAIVVLCSKIIENAEVDECYRNSAMEVLTSLCETAPNSIKKRAPHVIPVILQSALILMTELDDSVEDWLLVDDVDEGDIEEDVAAVGETSLDRISCALNGKAILQPFFEAIEKLLADGDWRKRHAALMAISAVGEGSKRAMEPLIEKVVDTVAPFLQDTHPRVRHAACNAMGQMATDFSPNLQKKCHEKAIGGLLNLLNDTSCYRVCAHAGAALVNFSEDCPQQVITPYLPAIMQKLEYVLETTFSILQEKGNKVVLEQIITTIASVADAAKEVFVQFYDRLMPPLKYILQHSGDNKFKILRGKTIECISLIGLAVGKEKFGNDAVEVMQILSTSMPDLAPDDPQCSYMISGWTRICRVLGPDFAPYLPLVMDPILRAASYNPQIALIDEEDAQEDDGTWQYTALGDNKAFGIKTSGLEEKATACEMIVCYARDLKEAFIPYIEKISEMVIEHLKFMFHDGVRASAAETMPRLIECVQSQGVPAMRTLWDAFFPALVEAAKKADEEEAEVLAEILNAIAECVSLLGAEGLAASDIEKIGSLLKIELAKYEERRLEREAEEADEDEDAEEAKEFLDEEMESEAAVMGRISDIIHACFEVLGENFFPYVEGILPQIANQLDVKRYYSDRQWGICILDDVIEFATSRIVSHQQHFVTLLLKGLTDEYAEVRQAAAYGLGVMALKGGPEFHDSVVTALEPLAVMINKPDARATENNAVATENAIAAVAKILRHVNVKINVDQVIPTFLGWLPTYEDEEESIHIYSYLCDLIESNNPACLGTDNSNLPHILDIILTAFIMGAFNDEAAEVKGRLVNILKMMQQNNVLERIFSVKLSEKCT
ncbi:unnamed protein product [Auanema sp. JU1783]|nr:unnamed protein product [Auanema sp. JU1783]